MINNWNNICTQIETAEGKLQGFIEAAGLSALQAKKLEKFTKEWNKTKKMAEDFDQFIAPVDPIKVESPFDQDDFRYIWKMWKEYLAEQHRIMVRSRMEQASLEFLAEISDNNPDKAIDTIRFAMKSNWKSLYKVESKTTQPKEDNNGSDF
ncbi:hypothetical protein [Sunxiuqinia sp. sy24]|uniref:hypothetical protein n=1 Tax=Sunxiuqinia sp. sy24 TaxID=3461495 RepID=UPI004045CEF8